jgi:ribonucleoside-diphosphate reductase alpha chain
VPSLLAAIGQVIETHMIRTGFLQPQDADQRQLQEQKALAVAQDGAGSAAVAGPSGKVCPRCSQRSLTRREGCWVCSNCAYSKCD